MNCASQHRTKMIFPSQQGRTLVPVLLMLFVFAGNNLKAQVNDAQLWLSAGVEKRITRDLSINFTQELRLNENITEAGTIYSDLGVSYDFLNRFRVGASYRFTLKRRPDDSYRPFHSWYVDARYREKIKPLVMILRLRYQSKYAEPYTSEKASMPANHFRAKLTLKYDLKKRYEPYIYAETYFRTCVPGYQSFDQLRLCAGVEYAFNRMHSIDLHYLWCHEYNVVEPEVDWVIGVSYSFTF